MPREQTSTTLPGPHLPHHEARPDEEAAVLRLVAAWYGIDPDDARERLRERGISPADARRAIEIEQAISDDVGAPEDITADEDDREAQAEGEVRRRQARERARDRSGRARARAVPPGLVEVQSTDGSIGYLPSEYRAEHILDPEGHPVGVTMPRAEYREPVTAELASRAHALRRLFDVAPLEHRETLALAVDGKPRAVRVEVARAIRAAADAVSDVWISMLVEALRVAVEAELDLGRNGAGNSDEEQARLAARSSPLSILARLRRLEEDLGPLVTLPAWLRYEPEPGHPSRAERALRWLAAHHTPTDRDDRGKPVGGGGRPGRDGIARRSDDGVREWLRDPVALAVAVERSGERELAAWIRGE